MFWKNLSYFLVVHRYAAPKFETKFTIDFQFSGNITCMSLMIQSIPFTCKKNFASKFSKLVDIHLSLSPYVAFKKISHTFDVPNISLVSI